MGTKKGPPTRTEFSGLTLEVRGIRKDLDGLGRRVDAMGEDLGRRIDSMGESLGQRIDAVREELAGALNHNTGVLKQILRAVEVGNERRDDQAAGLERRVRRLEEHAGLVPAE